MSPSQNNPPMLSFLAIPERSGNPAMDGIHLLWSPPTNCGYALEGFSIWRRRIFQEERKCIRLQEEDFNYLHRFYRHSTEELFLAFRHEHEDWNNWAIELRQYIQATAGHSVPGGALFGYQIEFSSVHYAISLEPGISDRSFFLVVVGLLNGKANFATIQYNPHALLLPFPVDRVVVYSSTMLRSLEVCFLNPKKDSDSWSGARLIAANVQLPFMQVNPELHSLDEEYRLAISRTIDPSTIGEFESFRQLSELANATYEAAEPIPPARIMVATATRDSSAPERPLLHTNALGLLNSLQIKYDLRKALGFAFLDQDELNDEASYDYKITGRFKKRHLEERVLGFHTVPVGSNIGRYFSLASIQFRYLAAEALTVGTFPEIYPGLESLCYKKGLRLQGGPLKIVYPEPVKKVVLFFDDTTTHNLRFSASTFSFRDRPYYEEGIVPLNQQRLEIEFPNPFDVITLFGHGFFVGLAFPCLEVGEDAESTVEISAYNYNVTYAPTPLPPAPSGLTAENIQQAWQQGTEYAAQPLGFDLHWTPPLSRNELPLSLWPPDLRTSPPLAPQYFLLEHWNQAESTEPLFQPFQQGETGNGEVFVLGNRNAPPTPASVVFGSDLLTVYPEQAASALPAEHSIRIRDVLVGNQTLHRSETLNHITGSHHQYRVWSVDVLGRRSAEPAYSNNIMLEKRLPPPSPVGIWDDLGNPWALEPLRGNRFTEEFNRQRGVFTRVIQATDSNLTEAERALLADQPFLTILYWRWGREERRQDPWVNHFRIYWRQNDPGVVRASMVTAPVRTGDHIRFAAILSNSLVADELRGQYLTIDKTPYYVVHHNDGLTVEFVVMAPVVRPEALPPARSSFELHRRATPEEERPAAWDQRISTVALLAADVYMYVVELGVLLPDTTGPRPPQFYYGIGAAGSALRGWFGVSAADSESYVEDEVELPNPLGGMPGNESAIVVAPVWATYYGRPVFSPPTPLPEVDTVIWRELRADSVPFRLRPDALFPALDPAGFRIRFERIAGSQLLGLLKWEGESLDSRRVRIDLPEANSADPPVYWTLLPAELAELYAATQQGSRHVPSKFLWGLAINPTFDLDALWTLVNPTPLAFEETWTDLLPNQAERYIYRLKLVDDTGRFSEAAAYVPSVYRVPEKTAPFSPALDVLVQEEAPGALRLQLDIWLPSLYAGDVNNFFVFLYEWPAIELSPSFNTIRENAQLLRVPGRADLRLKLANGTVLEPMYLDKNTTPDLSADQKWGWESAIGWRFLLPASYSTNYVIWGLSISAAGIPSALPEAKTILPLLPAPTLPDFTARAVDAAHDEIIIAGLLSDVMVRIEQSAGGSLDFVPVSPWLWQNDSSDDTITRTIPAPSGERYYRLRVRGKGDREILGESLIIH